MTQTQWRVTWFPPDKAERSMTTFEEAKARQSFRTAEENGWCPILESRELPDWIVIANPTLGIVERGGQSDG